MIFILVLFGVGVIAGALVRSRAELLRWAKKTTDVAVLVMLFLLGAAMGANQEVMANLHGLGLQALALTLAAVAGSVALGLVVERFFFRRRS